MAVTFYILCSIVAVIATIGFVSLSAAFIVALMMGAIFFMFYQLIHNQLQLAAMIQQVHKETVNTSFHVRNYKE